MKLDQTKLSRAIWHAVRYEPWLYELELDDDGWTSQADFQHRFQPKGRWEDYREYDPATMGDQLDVAVAVNAVDANIDHADRAFCADGFSSRKMFRTVDIESVRT